MNRIRKMTSLTITISFLIMSYTGIILFIAPKGRVANWSNWKLLGLDKTEYTNLHVTFMVLFLAGMILHLYLNWKPLLAYMKNASRQFSLLNQEFLFALSLNAVFVVGTLFYWTPFDQFLDLEDEIKSSWERKINKAPYGHAELSSLEEFASRTKSDANIIIQKLSEKGIKNLHKEKTIAQIAKENGKSPSQLFEMLRN